MDVGSALSLAVFLVALGDHFSSIEQRAALEAWRLPIRYEEDRVRVWRADQILGKSIECPNLDNSLVRAWLGDIGYDANRFVSDSLFPPISIVIRMPALASKPKKKLSLTFVQYTYLLILC